MSRYTSETESQKEWKISEVSISLWKVKKREFSGPNQWLTAPAGLKNGNN